jgi:hypothetical protein
LNEDGVVAVSIGDLRIVSPNSAKIIARLIKPLKAHASTFLA